MRHRGLKAWNWVPLRGKGSHNVGLTGLGFQVRGLYDIRLLI